MKRTLTAGFLVLFGLWPAVQFGLTQAYGTDPWKLFGWAMYTVPGPKPMVRIVGLLPDGAREKLEVAHYTPEERALLEPYVARRSVLGSLASQDDLVSGMLALHSAWDGLLVVIADPELDRETAIFTPRMRAATWWRDGDRPPLEISETEMIDLFSS